MKNQLQNLFAAVVGSAMIAAPFAWGTIVELLK
jgi:hypothetical protein